MHARASRQVFLVARVRNYHIPKYIHIFAQRFYTFRGIGRARVRDVHARGCRQVCLLGRVRNLHMQKYIHIFTQQFHRERGIGRARVRDVHARLWKLVFCYCA